MAYRPKIKDDVNGTVSDLALDAETVQGIDVVDRLKSVPLYVTSVTGTAAVTTSGSYYHAKWTLTDSRISNLYDGLRVSFKIPVAGNGSYGTGVCINSGNYHPVVFNVNSMVGTRYGVNSTMTLVYNSTQKGVLYINNTSTTVTGVWQIEDYDSNTTTTYGTLNYYMRPYVGANRLTAYKIVALDKDNRVIPITTEQYMGTYSTSTTYSKDDIVVSSSKYYKSLANNNKNKAVSNTSYWKQITMPSQFTPNTTAFKPDKIYFYNTTAGIAAGAVIGGQTLTEIGYNTSVCNYTFWASIASYKMIYLQGTYNTTTGLFTLDTGANYYKLVPNNTANLTLSSYFTSGKDYIFVGATYSSANYFQLAMVNIMYHFDGTNLVQYDTYRANTIVASIPSPVTESTVSGWGFTKNVGTVTKVNNTSPDANGNVTITIPTVDYPVTDVKVNNTSVVSSKIASISAVTKLGTRTGDITIANLKTDLGLGSAAYTDSTAYASSTHTHSSLKNGNYTASLPTLTANATLALTSDIPSAVTEATVSGWGFTKNAGTVTSVSAGPGLSISGTATTTPKVYIDSGYRLPTNTEWTNNTFTGIITSNHVDLKTLQYDGVYLLRYGTWTYIHTYVNESSDSTVNNMDHPSGYTTKHSYGAGAISLLYFTKYHSGTAWHYEWRTLGFNNEFDYMGEFTTTTSGAINPGAWVKTIFTRPLSNGTYDINLPTLSSNETLAVTSDLGDQVTYSYSGGVLTITSK